MSYMNPFHNMAMYRELQRASHSPFIPLFPIIKKDLTFLFDGNETQVDSLVNFEKLRMLSQQIRNIKKYCETPIMVGNTVLRMLSEHLHYVSTECNVWLIFIYDSHCTYRNVLRKF